MNETAPSTIDLIVLGFLTEGPMSAYDLAKLIERKHATRLVKISTPAVYKCCKRLYDAGLLQRKLTRESERPEKATYSLAKPGRDRFLSLMDHYSSDFSPFFLDSNAFVFHLERLAKKDGIRMLKNLRAALAGVAAWIEAHEKEEAPNLTFASRAIIKQYRMTVSTLVLWCDETLSDYRQAKT